MHVNFYVCIRYSFLTTTELLKNAITQYGMQFKNNGCMVNTLHYHYHNNITGHYHYHDNILIHEN